jgi:hypothetical protein
MFRMIPGINLNASNSVPVLPALGVLAGLSAVLAVSMMGLFSADREVPKTQPSETEMAQRSAAVVTTTYRAQVDIDRRDRMLLVSYDEASVMDADRFAWTVCDTIRTEPNLAASTRVLREWRVVALPASGMPGSCRIGLER